jgi:hypothetical protein
VHHWIKTAYRKLRSADTLQNELLRKEHTITDLKVENERITSLLDCLQTAVCMVLDTDTSFLILNISDDMHIKNTKPEIVRELENCLKI